MKRLLVACLEEALTSPLRSDSLSLVTEKNVTGIGVLNGAVKAAIDVISGFFTLGVSSMGGRAGGVARLAGAPPVRQLPSRSSSPIGVGLGGSNRFWSTP